MDSTAIILTILIIILIAICVIALIGAGLYYYFYGSTNTTGTTGTSTGTTIGATGSSTTGSEEAICGYPSGTFPIPDTSIPQVVNILGGTNGIYYKVTGAPYSKIKINNYDLGKYTVNVVIDTVDTGCHTLDITQDYIFIVRKAHNGYDYKYSWDNGKLYIESEFGKEVAIRA